MASGGFDSDDQRRAFFGKLASGTLGARKKAAMKAKNGKFIGDSGYRGSETGGRIGATAMSAADKAEAAFKDADSIKLGQSRRIARGAGPEAAKAAQEVKERDRTVGRLKREAARRAKAAQPFRDAARRAETLRQRQVFDSYMTAKYGAGNY